MQRADDQAGTGHRCRSQWLHVACVAWLLAGCPAKSRSSSTPDAGDTSDAGAGCIGDPRAEMYGANLQKMGTAGLFRFMLVKSDPAPPAKGNNTWQVQLSDLAGNALRDATLTVKTLMPDHGHGSPVAATATPSADGYQVTPLYLFMSGLWQVTINAKSGTETDSAAFTFCVPR